MNIVMIGNGGHSKVIRDLIHQNDRMTLIGILDDKYFELQEKDGVWTGPSSSAAMLLERYNNLKFIVAIGDNQIRESMVSRLGLNREQYVSLIHPAAVVSSSAYIGEGTVVLASAVLNADVLIGNHSIINTGSIVEHDCMIEDFVHLAPKAALTGGVTVRKGAFIGAGATVIPGKVIGEWSIVGAGATVIRDINAHSTAVGNPALTIKSRGGEAYDPNETAKTNFSVQSSHVRRRTIVY